MQDKKILVIDDDVSLGQAIRLTFARTGAEVFTAVDGRDGLRQFYEHRPDLVILDVRMPDIDGWETCRQIRLLSNVPIIMLTTLDKDEDILRGFDYGADDFVTKPFSRDVLLARARAVLRRVELLNEAEDHAVYNDDHLNIDLEKGDCIYLKPSDDREVIRRHALGKFRDLIRASATSPANCAVDSVAWQKPHSKVGVRRSSGSGVLAPHFGQGPVTPANRAGTWR